MQVQVDVKCMQTNFGGHGLFGFGDFGPLCFRPNFPFEPWTIIIKTFKKRKSVGLIAAIKSNTNKAV